MGVACARCLTHISGGEDGNRLPPWCPSCGVDRKVYLGQEAPAAAAAGPAPAWRDIPTAAVRADEPPPAGEGTFAPPGRGIVSDAELLAAAQQAVPPRSRVSAGGTLLLLLLGGGALMGGAFLASNSLTKLNTYRRAEGQVVDFVTKRTRRGDASYPVVAYQVAGQSYRVQAHNSSGLFSHNYQQGDSVRVLYAPEQPGEGTLESFSELWLGSLVCGGLGSALLFLWVLAMRHRRRPQPVAPADGLLG
jgi:hypothetical protein